jgi:hypothetical protein
MDRVGSGNIQHTKASISASGLFLSFYISLFGRQVRLQYVHQGKGVHTVHNEIDRRSGIVTGIHRGSLMHGIGVCACFSTGMTPKDRWSGHIRWSLGTRFERTVAIMPATQATGIN